MDSQVESILNRLLQLALKKSPFEAILDQVIELILDVPWAAAEPCAAVFLVDRTSPTLILKASRGLAPAVVAGCAQVPLGRCLCGRAALTGALQFTSHVDRRLETTGDGTTDHGQYAVPITAEDGRILGVLLFYVAPGHAYAEKEAAFLGAATNVLSLLLQRKETELALLESERRFRDLAESMSDIIWEVDSEGVYTYCSDRAGQVLGYGLDALIGRKLTDFLAVEAADYLIPLFRSLMARRQPFRDVENWNLRKDGTAVCLLTSGIPVLDGSGGLVGYRGVHKDITQAKQAEQALRRSEAQTKAVLDSTVDGIITIDEEGIVESLNPAAQRMFGYATQEVVGKDANVLIPPDPDHPALLTRGDETGPAKLLGLGRETQARRKDGSVFPVELSLGEARLGDWRKFTGVVRDITPRKEAEAALAHARQREAELRWRIQDSLLQGPIPGNLRGAVVAAMTLPSEYVDGDFYDFYDHRPDCFDVVVGDVMGKGTTAALVGAATKNHCLHALSHLLLASDSMSLPEPEDLVGRVHRDVTPRLLDLERFVTLVYARFRLGDRSLTFVNCGHPRILHYSRSSRQCRRLEGGNVPLGFLESEQYTQWKTSFEPGDLFLFYSDGVTEVCNREGALFGEERLLGLLESHHCFTPQAFVQDLRDTVIQFSETRSLSDDLTCIAVRIDGGPAPHELISTSDLNELGLIRSIVRQVAAEAGLSETAVAEVELAVDEAAANVMQHAYEGRKDGRVRIEHERDRHRLLFRLTHCGQPFDRNAAPPPAFDGSRDSGFGLFIIDRVMDEVDYVANPDGSHSLVLAKSIGGDDR